MLSKRVPCEDCVPSYLRNRLPRLRPELILPSSPFIFTFVLVAIVAWRTLFPLLSGRSLTSYNGANDHLPPNKPPRTHLRRASVTIKSWASFALDRAAAITFSTTIALSAVLAELIFCEISDVLNPAARRVALELTVTVLLFSLVIVTPALEIHSITSAAVWQLQVRSRYKLLLAITIDFVGLAGWLAVFWWIGQAVLGADHAKHGSGVDRHGFSAGSLERIGIIGISLMAALAGFAAVSSLWQTFGVKKRRVSDTDISRKQGGLQATEDLLAAKESRLRALERKMSDAAVISPVDKSFMGRVLNTIRGSDPDQTEAFTLRLEISGLQTMRVSLSNSLSVLTARRDAQVQASTAIGRFWLTTSYLFSIYCLYRLAATSLTSLRRWWTPSTTFASTDPINNVLAIVARTWDPSLDRAAWSRQISFLLSGLMLLASFNAVLQTVLLFSRFTPARLLHSAAQQNLALLVSQISAVYVVSSALLLRSNLPAEMRSVIQGALEVPLDTSFVERWFEGWFLGAAAITVVAIVVGKTFGGSNEWDDDYADEGDVEVGEKMH